MKKYIFSFCLLGFLSCKQHAFLDERYNYALVIPGALEDLEAILDNTRAMNGTHNVGVIPALGEVASDDYYLDAVRIRTLKEQQLAFYTWNPDPFLAGTELLDWSLCYRSVYYANTVLDFLPSLSSRDENYAARLKGSALFYRAFAFFHLAQVFAPPYRAESASTDLSIYLRLTADVGQAYGRATVQETYDRIIADLSEALQMLPDRPRHKTRPSKAASHALLARLYLSMRDYERAGVHASESLALQSELLNFPALDDKASYPFARFNDEVIYHSILSFYQAPSVALLAFGFSLTDSLLYHSYEADDLRKSLYYRESGGLPMFRGSHDGTQYFFGGLATDEMYLIRAESLIRSGRWQEGTAVLDTLLETRFADDGYTPRHPESVEDALQIVLKERRKSLVHRGLRWMDLRRLALEGQHSTLTRVIDGERYTFSWPNGYVFPMPPLY